VWPEQAVAALGADDRDELTKDVDGKIQIVPSNLALQLHFTVDVALAG
jgi:hypothetical protein